MPIDVHRKSIKGENIIENFVPFLLLVNLSSTQSSKNIVLNKFFMRILIPNLLQCHILKLVQVKLFKTCTLRPSIHCTSTLR